MKKTIESLSEIHLVGITARTSNAREMNPDTAIIGPMVERFFAEGMQAHIPNRANPGRLFGK